MKSYLVPANSVTVETTIKASRFITHIWRAQTPADAQKFIAQLKREHFKANHVCSAFIAGEPGDYKALGFSDDGEPTGTAGKPMLAVLQGCEIGEIAAAVVRYFGGTKLGTGGLVRAYSGAVKAGLEELQTELRQQKTKLEIQFTYAQKGLVDKFLATKNCEIESTDFADKISQQIVLPLDCSQEFQADLIELSNAQVKIIPSGEIIF